MILAGWTGLENESARGLKGTGEDRPREIAPLRLVYDASRAPKVPEVALDRHNVTDTRSRVAPSLAAALQDWLQRSDVDHLRRVLLRVLLDLDDSTGR